MGRPNELRAMAAMLFRKTDIPDKGQIRFSVRRHRVHRLEVTLRGCERPCALRISAAGEAP